VPAGDGQHEYAGGLDDEDGGGDRGGAVAAAGAGCGEPAADRQDTEQPGDGGGEGGAVAEFAQVPDQVHGDGGHGCAVRHEYGHQHPVSAVAQRADQDTSVLLRRGAAAVTAWWSGRAP
jgi:hypothetical protein